MRHLYRLLMLAMVSLAMPVAGCSSDDPTVPAVAAPRGDAGLGDRGCIDEDNDGFGDGCGRQDCDDNDPEVTDLCFRCGSEPATDCPCEPGTEPDTTCTPPVIEGEVDGVKGTFVCTEGTRYCRGGTWGECEAIGEYVFRPGS